MNQSNDPSARELEAARLLLARLGISPEQLTDRSAEAPQHVPTFDDYIDRVSKSVSVGTLRVYETYWNRVRSAWGGRRLDEPTPLEIRELAERMKEQLVIRRNARGGRSAAEHLIASLRCLYRSAVADGLILDRANPALRVAKPRRLASTRRALRAGELEQIRRAAEETGKDPDLDTLLIDLHSQTACRRGGALALRGCDLDASQCLVRLREKGGTERWQPVSPSLMSRLLAHEGERGVDDPLGQLLRSRKGEPVTRRRYDSLWLQIGKHLPWVAVQQVSTHWLRHTTLTWVERTFGYGIARAYAGHDGKGNAGATATYVRADVYEVAMALAAYTNERHPLELDERLRCAITCAAASGPVVRAPGERGE
ncbi:tyrosine-type recombinase/integrase [Catellatospora paridis]|uniref:tyrosine-type recombinase/integrase n=1 Tax=Catellatospora paridis TaxID=1617086 RepID=UPI0012D3B62A|nr:site-specific integrase [Catellatospora paridis]